MDTITAPATAPVRSAIAVLRISGPDTKEILSRVFRGRTKRLKPRMMHLGQFIAQGAVLDEGLCVFFPGPASYTGEDMAELSCHGSPGVMQALLEAICDAGARMAQPGEFTRRAFLNGKLELTQAEAVIDLIDSETRASARNAALQLEGRLGRQIDALREQLIGLSAHFSAVIDYPDDDIPAFIVEQAQDVLDNVSRDLEVLRGSFRQGALLRDGAVCVLAGRPNAGKSSLLNALSGEERAIVTPVPGTTRDVVEARIELGGIPVRLLDTAGLRETEDPVERLGVERTARALENAQLILAVYDGTEALFERDIDEMDGCPVIAVVNKEDLGVKLDVEALKKHFRTVITVSAATGEGIAELKAAMARALRLHEIVPDGTMVTNPRQAEVLARAHQAVARAASALRCGMTPDMVLTDSEEAVGILGELTGKSTTEDILGAIFSRFCVGK